MNKKLLAPTLAATLLSVMFVFAMPASATETLYCNSGQEAVWNGSVHVVSGTSDGDGIDCSNLSENFLINAGKGDDYVVGGTGDDELRGGWGTDGLFGGDGSDYIRGGQGSDYMDCGLDDGVADLAEGGQNFDVASNCGSEDTVDLGKGN